MPTITRLELQARRRDRVNVFLDEAFAFSVSVELAAALRKGQVLSEAETTGLRAEDGYRQALGRALRYLGHRSRTRVEVERKLAESEVEPPVVARVLGRLDELGLLDDADYAARFVEQRQNHRPEGARALRYALGRRGVPDHVVAAVTEGIDEDTLARRVALDRLPRYAGCDRPVFERRLGGFLQRRGFGPDAVRAAVRAAWEARGVLSSPGQAPESSLE